MRIETLAIVAVLLIAVLLLRAQYGRAVSNVTHPDPEATPLFPVTTPITRPICGGDYAGTDCLHLP
jgi:hypothetical protein